MEMDEMYDTDEYEYLQQKIMKMNKVNPQGYPYDIPPSYEQDARELVSYTRAMRDVLAEQTYLDAKKGWDQFYDYRNTAQRMALQMAKEFQPSRPDNFWMPPEFLVAREPSNWGHVTDHRLTPFLKHLEYELDRRLTAREVNAIVDRWNLEKTEYILEWRRFDEESDKWFADFIRLRPWEQALSDDLHREIARQVEEIDTELSERQIRTHVKRWFAHRWERFKNRWERRVDRVVDMIPKSSTEAIEGGKNLFTKVSSSLTLESIAKRTNETLQGLSKGIIEQARILDERFQFYTSALTSISSNKSIPTALELARVMDLRDKARQDQNFEVLWSNYTLMHLYPLRRLLLLLVARMVLEWRPLKPLRWQEPKLSSVRAFLLFFFFLCLAADLIKFITCK